MGLEKKLKYLSFFPVIKKKNTIKLDKNATKCYNNTTERKKPFLLLVQLNGWKEPFIPNGIKILPNRRSAI